MLLTIPSSIGKATLYLFIAYWIVTILGILLTIFFAATWHPPTPEELGVPVTQAPAYLMTLPYHPLLNLLIWPLFGWLYLRGISLKKLRWEMLFSWAPIGWLLQLLSICWVGY